MFKMKSGFVALLLVLALTSCSAAAVDLRWQRPQEGELQGMEYAAGYKPQQEMSYDQGRNELGQEHDSLRDLPYGFMEKSIQQEIDYPTSETFSAAQEGVSTQNISVNSLTSGAVEVVYRSPDEGRVSLNLYNDKEDVLIHIDARFDWYRWKNVLVLNSKRARGGRWLREVRPEGFPFPCCGYITTITLRVEIHDDAFIVSANGIPIVEYPFRRRIRPPVETIQFYFEDTGASRKAKLKSLTVEY